MSGSDERPPQHPGEVEPGPPGGTRYMCPLCDWYLDVAGPDLTRDAPLPRVRNRPAPGATLDDITRQLAREQFEEIEAALAEHLREAHTAPVVLNP